MARGHPVDHLGRVLPSSDWPADRAAPARLEFVRRFVNTTNRESGADRLVRPDDAAAWLAAQNRPSPRLGPDDLEHVRTVREALRAVAIDHRDGVDDAESMASFATAVSSVTFVFDTVGRTVPFRPITTAPSDDLLGAVALIVAESVAAASWVRLKACTHCAWAFYDRSNNRSSRWCSMSACGGRSKVREHRSRQRARPVPGS